MTGQSERCLTDEVNNGEGRGGEGEAWYSLKVTNPKPRERPEYLSIMTSA